MTAPRFATGTFTGTGSALNVALQFTPSYIVIWNETDGDERFEFIAGLTAGSAYTVLDSGVNTTNLATSATNYITAGTMGFKCGTGISESAKVYRYVAFGQ